MDFEDGFIDGCFDLFHYGHINGLYQSKIKCKTLHLATHSNNEILIAKKCFPIYDFNHRLLLLKNCKFIDKLYLNSTPYDTTIDIIHNINCEIFFHGEDGIDKYPLLDINNANKLFIYKRTLGVSTSNILKRLYNYKNNIKIDTFNNIEYLTNLYNEIISFDKVPIYEIDNIIFLKCDWDLFNQNHINLIKKIKKKYTSHTLIIDIISYDLNQKKIFNKFEIRVLLSGIIGIYDIILDNNKTDLNCKRLILINTDIDNIFNYDECIIDNEFNNEINELVKHKEIIIDSIDFVKYKNKINF